MSRPRILALDYHFRKGHLDPLVAIDEFDWLLTDRQLHPDEMPDCDLVVFTDERINGFLPTIAGRYADSGVPSLHFLDGVLEWRNLFENPAYDYPTIPSPPLHAITCASKLACIGPSQARQLESMGHFGKCEVVGAPRLGAYSPQTPGEPRSDRKPRLLISTARTPTFNDDQERLALAGFAQCRDEIARFPNLETEWRIPAKWAEILGVETTQTNTDGDEFKQSLERATLFASTPSTTVLEAMMRGLPTAIIDPFRRPKLLQAAWLVCGPGDLSAALPEMIQFPALMRRHQAFVLADQLHHDPIGRATNLMRSMIEAGRAARASRQPLSLPARILPLNGEPQPSVAEPVERLFPDYRPFERRSNEALAIEVAQLKRALAIRERRKPALVRLFRKAFRKPPVRNGR